MSSDEFRWALQNGDIDVVKGAISKDKGKCNEKINRRPPLNIAADYGQTDVIELLLENGATVDAEDNHGITPLLSAIFEGHTAAVKFLLSKGASKTGKAPDGSSYIDCAEKAEIKELLQA